MMRFWVTLAAIALIVVIGSASLLGPTFGYLAAIIGGGAFAALIVLMSRKDAE